MDDRMGWICDLLLAAAYADEEFHERERTIIAELVAKLLDAEALPGEVEARIEAFDPKGFDARLCAERFKDDSLEDKLELLGLVVAVHEADDEYDFAEDDFVRQIGHALGLADADLEGLVIEYEVAKLRDSLSKLRATPPPVPDRPKASE